MIRINIRKNLLLCLTWLATSINGAASGSNSAFLQSGVFSSSVGVSQAQTDPLPAAIAPTQLYSVREDQTNEKTIFELTDSAKDVFQKLTGPVYVVGIHGRARMGKSTNLSFFVREW